MLQAIHLSNYRSFLNATVDLSPFTLVVGANGAGKTNFLKAFVDANLWLQHILRDASLQATSLDLLPAHFNHPGTARLTFSYGKNERFDVDRYPGEQGSAPGTIVLFRLNPEAIASVEPVVGQSFVAQNGRGTTQCLEALKNGDHEEWFNAAERALKTYVPEIEKLSFITRETGKKQMQVRERGIGRPVLASELSEGTRLIIALLAIVYQPVKPPVICLEDVDRGMHPRVFEQFVKLMQRLAREHDVQIIASTHNPYLVDCFQEEPNAVVIVEKENGASTLSTLAAKLERLGTDESEMPLGNLWFSGFVGGVPEFLRRRKK